MVAMSGGVDSSVTAFLVLQQGFSALGATMRLINNYDPSPDKARACGAETDIADAKAVCARLGCPQDKVDRLILPDDVTYAERPRDFRLASDKIRGEGVELGTFEEDLSMCMRDFGLAG